MPIKKTPQKSRTRAAKTAPKKSRNPKETGTQNSPVLKKRVRNPGGDPGRPSTFTKRRVKQAKKLCRLGFTDEQICGVFEISVPTLYTWQKKHPELREAMLTGKALSDANVANMLYHRAVGMKVPDIHFSAYEGHVTQTPYDKYLAPDVAAMRMWLKNRQPDLWKENIIDVEGGTGLFSINIHETLKPKDPDKGAAI